MIRRDLAAAGIPYETDAGVFDFHALRHQFLSDLAQSGVHPKVAQELARHSTISLTMDRYSHVLDGQKTDALESLPSLGNGHQSGHHTLSRYDSELSQPVTMGGNDPLPIASIEPYEATVFSTDCHEMSPGDSSSGGRTRTYDTRIMISERMDVSILRSVFSLVFKGFYFWYSRKKMRKGKCLGKYMGKTFSSLFSDNYETDSINITPSRHRSAMALL